MFYVFILTSLLEHICVYLYFCAIFCNFLLTRLIINEFLDNQLNTFDLQLREDF